MIAAIEKVFCRYGTDLILQRNGVTTAFQGFLHSVTSQSRQSAQRELTVLGEIPRGQYVLIAPAYLELQVGDTVVRMGKHYVLGQVESIPYRNEVLYHWGLCVEKGGEEA